MVPGQLIGCKWMNYWGGGGVIVGKWIDCWVGDWWQMDRSVGWVIGCKWIDCWVGD